MRSTKEARPERRPTTRSPASSRSGNQGGFRYKKHPSGKGYLFLILYTDLADPDWPDHLDVDLGRFTYYGDNKRRGHALHETSRGGNRALRDLFRGRPRPPTTAGDGSADLRLLEDEGRPPRRLPRPSCKS
jgi:Restriction endonuclease AspBHI N-terminal